MSSKLDATVQAMPHLLLVFAMGAVAIPVAVGLVFWGRGSIEHLTHLFLPAVLVGPPLALASAGAWIYSLRVAEDAPRTRLRWVAAAMLGVAAFALVVAPSYVAGRILNASDIRAARGYCMMLVPRIEAYKREKGTYPAKVQELLPEGRPVPRLLRTDEPFYRTVGAAYEFVFADPSGWDSGHYYFSEDVPLRGHWEKW